MAKRKQAMPSYYGKNIAQNAQRKALKRLEAERAAREEARRAAHEPCGLPVEGSLLDGLAAAEQRAAEKKAN